MEIKSAEIIVRDVGLGDSIYVKVKRDNDVEVSYLIDTGCLQYVNILKEDGIDKINTLILTHKHLDHISGATHIIEHYKEYGLKNVILSFRDKFFASKTNKALSGLLKKIYEEHNPDIGVFDINDKKAVEAILDFHVLYPQEEDHYHMSNMNKNSIVLLLQVGRCNVLFTGDVTQQEEQFILFSMEKLSVNDVQILKVPHHGSRTSTSSDFLNKLSDLKYAIVSASALRMKKLPSEDFEDRWRHFNETHSCDMFYTEDGNIGQNVQLTIDGVSGCVRVCNCQPKHF